MQSTGKSTETTWSDNLQNVKRQAPGRAGQTDWKEETGRPETDRPGTRHMQAERRHSMQEYIKYISWLKKSLLKRKHTAIRFIASAGYIYFFSWLYIYQPAVNKNKQNISTGQPVNKGCF